MTTTYAVCMAYRDAIRSAVRNEMFDLRDRGFDLALKIRTDAGGDKEYLSFELFGEHEPGRKSWMEVNRFCPEVFSETSVCVQLEDFLITVKNQLRLML